jgi:tetratricopeptide (TPR) repeat protein
MSNTKTKNLRFIGAAMVTALATACAVMQEPAPPTVVESTTPEQRVAAIRAAAGVDDKELAVQPLRDPQVEDLRETAAKATAARDYAAAAEALNQAILIVPEDPAVLQERAEIAELQRDFDRAETLAQRAFDLGSQVGPLCRQHWETIRQIRERRLEIASAPTARQSAEETARQATSVAALKTAVAQAAAQRDACTVPGINRM